MPSWLLLAQSGDSEDLWPKMTPTSPTPSSFLFDLANIIASVSLSRPECPHPIIRHLPPLLVSPSSPLFGLPACQGLSIPQLRDGKFIVVSFPSSSLRIAQAAIVPLLTVRFSAMELRCILRHGARCFFEIVADSRQRQRQLLIRRAGPGRAAY